MYESSHEFSNVLGKLGVVLTTLFAIATTILWLVIGWRAMRAHERIATSLEDGKDR